MLRAAVADRETQVETRPGCVGWVPLEPLEGYTVGVTADRRASEQAELLRRRGARVLDAPTIATAYLGSDERLAQRLDRAGDRDAADVLVITTGIGIRAWIEAAQSWGLDLALLDALAGARVIARGPKAAAAAQALGLEVWATAPDERMTGRAAMLAGEARRTTHVAVQCFGDDTSESPSRWPRVDARRHHGARVPLAAARRHPARGGAGARGARRSRARGHVHVGARGAQPVRHRRGRTARPTIC